MACVPFSSSNCRIASSRACSTSGRNELGSGLRPVQAAQASHKLRSLRAAAASSVSGSGLDLSYLACILLLGALGKPWALPPQQAKPCGIRPQEPRPWPVPTTVTRERITLYEGLQGDDFRQAV